MHFSPATKLTAVVGNPIKHSLSPFIHNTIYEREGIDAVWLAFENQDIGKLIVAVRALPIHLTAVTLPHKETVMPFLDEIDERAREIGAVNTVINSGGKLKGFNTDVVGIERSLSGTELKNKNVLVLGAGGVAHAILYHLREKKSKIYVHDRTLSKTESLTKKFGGTSLEKDSLNTFEYDVIINATPVGLPPNTEATPIPKDLIKKGSTVFDLVYNPPKTTLLKHAEERGAKPISGLLMFLEQALEQQRLWLDREIKDRSFLPFLEEELERMHGSH